MPDVAADIPLLDLAPPDVEAFREAFRRDVLAGLTADPKHLHAKYFYDEEGSRLFDRITELPEYYLTRTEAQILRDDGKAIAEAVGPRVLLVEYGSGSSVKTRILLDRLHRPAAYVPIDISREHLVQTARGLMDRYPDLPVLPVCADYGQTVHLPPLEHEADRTVVFFPGSTIGNMVPDEAVTFLHRARDVAGPGGGLLVGADLQKDVPTMEAAYDDAAGVTAAFNENLLRRINEELGADFDPTAFRFGAYWNPEHERVESHLYSLRPHTVHVAGEAISFEEGESIHTESAYKFTLDGFADLARRGGFEVERVWTDARDWFSVQLLRARA